MTQKIQLTQGQVAIVCDCCYHKIKDYKWSAKWDKKKQAYYAFRNVRISSGKRTGTTMHNAINNTPKGYLTDHIDGNTLNNTCKNLRTVTSSQNQMNSPKHSTNKSGYKGVSWEKLCDKWKVQISVNGNKKHIGVFENIMDAALAYDREAIKLHGDFARLNFPLGETQ